MGNTWTSKNPRYAGLLDGYRAGEFDDFFARSMGIEPEEYRISRARHPEACGDPGCEAYCSREEHVCGCDCSFGCAEDEDER